MARGDIKIPIAADTSRFEKAVQNGVIEPVTDAEAALKKLAGADTGDIDADMKRAQADTEKFGREVKDSGEALDRLGFKSKESTRKASEGFKEAGREAGSSGREAAASFSGGFDDVQDVIQETIANAFGGFGPMAAGAGIAAAAVVGAAFSQVQAAQEKLEQTRQAAGELAGELYQNGGTLPLQSRVEELLNTLTSERIAVNPLENVLNGWLDLGTTLDAVKRTATATRLPIQQVMQAMTGSNLATTKATLEQVNAKIAEQQELLRGYSVWDQEAQSAQDYLRSLEAVQTGLQGTVTQQELAQDAIGSTFVAAQRQAQTAADQQQQIVDAQTSRIDDLSAAWQGAATDAAGYWKTNEDGSETFDWESYLNDAEATLAAANDYKAKIVGLPADIQAEGERVFAAQGAQAADAYATAYLNASDSDKARFVGAAAANGTAAGNAAATALANAIPTTIPVVVKVHRDTTEWDNWTPQQKTAFVSANPAAASVMRYQ